MNSEVGEVEVTAAMEKAGADSLREHSRDLATDPSYVVRAIYMAMEYERRDLGDAALGFVDEVQQVDGR